MTRQEEIREGIGSVTSDYCSQIMGRRWVTPELTSTILSYLHSQGVVIKVDDAESPFGFRLEPLTAVEPLVEEV